MNYLSKRTGAYDAEGECDISDLCIGIVNCIAQKPARTAEGAAWFEELRCGLRG